MVRCCVKASQNLGEPHDAQNSWNTVCQELAISVLCLCLVNMVQPSVKSQGMLDFSQRVDEVPYLTKQLG